MPLRKVMAIRGKHQQPLEQCPSISFFLDCQQPDDASYDARVLCVSLELLATSEPKRGGDAATLPRASPEVCNVVHLESLVSVVDETSSRGSGLVHGMGHDWREVG